jgi:hypothetical protein
MRVAESPDVRKHYSDLRLIEEKTNSTLHANPEIYMVHAQAEPGGNYSRAIDG